MRYHFLIFFLLFTVHFGFAQNRMFEDSTSNTFPDSLFRVDSIKVQGNEETKEFVVVREMSLRHDSLVTHAGIEYDKNRIYSLGLFNRVEIGVEPESGDKANLLVNVHERWYIYPYPVFGLKDRDWSKVYYGLGLMHLNFRGRNEKLFGSFALGYDPWVSLSYRNPFLDEGGSYFLETRLSYNRVRNRSVELQQIVGDFDEEEFNAFATVGKRFGIQHTVWVNGGYRTVTLPELSASGTTITGSSDRFPQATFGYSYDSRDLAEYAAYGTVLVASVTKFGLPSTSVNFAHFNFDFRRYIPLDSRFVLTGRLFSVLSSGGQVPSYEHVYFGYGDRIRGHYREVMEGEDLVGASTELHYVLLAPKYIHIGFLPKEFSLWRYGLTAALFGDAGKVWYRGDKLDWSHVPSGYGGGLHFLLPFNIVLRTEYGWNEYGKGEFMAIVGTSF